MDDVAHSLTVLKAHGIVAPIDAALVLGTGLGALVGELDDAVSIPYSALPGFPLSGVSGHSGKLHAGMLSGRRVLVMQGRNHYYEHGNARAMRTPIAVMAALGAQFVMLTNAAGSLLAHAGPGSIVAISDHINFSGLNPLIGETEDRRFVPMTDAYDRALLQQLLSAAQRAGHAIKSGIYMWFSGPSFETPAEIRMARTMGADLVGMSTVPEVIMARFFGLRVVALSMVTNMAAGIDGANPTHEETKQIAGASAQTVQRIIAQFFKEVKA